MTCYADINCCLLQEQVIDDDTATSPFTRSLGETRRTWGRVRQYVRQPVLTKESFTTLDLI